MLREELLGYNNATFIKYDDKAERSNRLHQFAQNTNNTHLTQKNCTFTCCLLLSYTKIVVCFLIVANESTRRRVVFYTLAEYILLAATSGLQVVYIRRLFSKSVAYNRV